MGAIVRFRPLRLGADVRRNANEKQPARAPFDPYSVFAKTPKILLFAAAAHRDRQCDETISAWASGRPAPK